MKTICSIILIIFSFCAAQAQDSPYKYWKMENKAVRFEAIYEMKGVNVDSIRSLIMNFIPQIKGVKNIHENSSGLTAELSGYLCDFRKMGYSTMSAPFFIQHPLYGDIAINIKDGRYRLVISNLISNKTDDMIEKRQLFTNTEIEAVILKLNKSGWATSNGKVKMNTQLEDDLYQSFAMPTSKSDW